MTGTRERYLALLKAPGIWEKALAFYALMCVAFLYMGIQEPLRRWGTEAHVGALLATLAIPSLFYFWGRRKPARDLAGDVRVWLLAISAVTGAGIGFATCPRDQWLDLFGIAAILTACFVGGLYGYLKARLRRDDILAKAELTGWRLSEKDESNLSGVVEETLFKDMSSRQRLRHNLILASGFVAFLSAMGLLFYYRVPGDVGYFVLWEIFFIYSITLMVYYGTLVRRQFVQKKRTAIELDAARRMQMALMPTEDPRLAGFEIAGVTLPAEEVGGDLYAYLPAAAAGGPMGVVLADVSGKAMKAAIATVLLSGILRAEGRRDAAPSERLSRVNAALLGGLDPFTFVAMQVLSIDPSSGAVRYSNAGQVHPLLLRDGTVTWIMQNALPLGIADDVSYSTVDADLRPGDLLVLLSDGITEAMNENRELFGSQRIEEALLSLDPSKPARRLIEDLVAGVDAFRGKAIPSDDRTLVVIKRT
jgi:serine phosphatase RsbU (regulator of sigma subunit)